MSRYLDPKADVVFKKIFGDHPHLLISFLNAVLPLPDDRQIIELPKLPIHSPEEKQLKLLWLRFLREINEETRAVPQELLDVPEIAEAVGFTQESAYSKWELEYYENYWDQVRREKTLMSDEHSKGLKIGEAKGIEQGIEQSITQGRVEGIITVAKNLLQAGADVEFVV